MREVPEAEGGTAKVLEPAVDGLRWAVARSGAVEEREDVRGALLQRAAEATDLFEQRGDAVADRVDHRPHHLLRLVLVGFAVGGDDALVDAPGRFDLDVLLGGEHRGRKGDPLYTARRTLHTGADLLTDRQHERLDKLFAGDRHVQVECTWGIYQRMISAYRHPDRAAGRVEMSSVIDALADSVPEALVELRKLGRTLTRRACDVLAYFDRPRTSNGPTEAVNGRLEHLRGLALGFRNLTNYIARALLEAGGFRPHLHPEL